jgi:hypothetical protein
MAVTENVLVRKLGLPLVRREWAHHGGYHYYPSIDRVKSWISDTGFTVRDDTVGDGYHHFFIAK